MSFQLKRQCFYFNIIISRYIIIAIIIISGGSSYDG